MQCRFEEINQPKSAQPNELIEISISVFDKYCETSNPHKGVLCILVPYDWEFISCDYSSELGNGAMEFAPNWADSAEICYPAEEFEGDMKWIGLVSDAGYTYSEPMGADVTIRLRVGQKEGCFNLGYLATKATPNLICTPWSPFSYPHPIGIPDTCHTDLSYIVNPAPRWDAIFDRDSGWTGADGIYSIPLSGVDVYSGSNSEKTLFLFSDTFIGNVDSNDHRSNSVLVNNTLALLETTQPVPEEISFFWGSNDNGQPEAVFTPNTPNSNPGEWYWLMDGISLNGKIYVFGLRLQHISSGGVFNFEPVGVNLISFTIDSTEFIRDYDQIDTPLFCKNDSEGWEIVLGQAIMPMTEESGNPGPDDYIYIYGPRSTGLDKELVAARVLPENIENFSLWEFWDGENWGVEIENCASITNQISQEFSVTPIKNNKFVLIFQLGSQVAIRFGESPVGPFNYYRTIYNCPEVEIDPDIFIYNAKAHPHISEPDELLISYNVNSFDFGDHLTSADIYRPRFITLQFTEENSTIFSRRDGQSSEVFSLSQNYPNPFNNRTKIYYTIPHQSHIRLVIYNLIGKEVITLINQDQPPGSYLTEWDGKDKYGIPVSSGLYFYSLSAAGKGSELFETTEKMVLIK